MILQKPSLWSLVLCPPRSPGRAEWRQTEVCYCLFNGKFSARLYCLGNVNHRCVIFCMKCLHTQHSAHLQLCCRECVCGEAYAWSFLNGISYKPGKQPPEKDHPAVFSSQHARATHHSHLPQGSNSSFIDPSLATVVQEVHLSCIVKAPSTEVYASKQGGSAVASEKLLYSYKFSMLMKINWYHTQHLRSWIGHWMVAEGHTVNMAGLLMKKDLQGRESIHRWAQHKTDSEDDQERSAEQESAPEPRVKPRVTAIVYRCLAFALTHGKQCQFGKLN